MKKKWPVTSTSHNQFTEHNTSFYLFLSILFLLPIPLGANRPWAWSLFELAIFGLTLYTTFRMRGHKDLGASHYMNMLVLWIGFILVSCLQIIPLPLDIVSQLSPHSAQLYSLANASQFYLSTDVGQSIISLIKLLSLLCLMILTFQLVNTEQRIRQLLMVMVASGTFQALYGSVEVLLGLETSIIFGFEVDQRATGSFVYHNHYANFLMLCLAAGVGLIVTSLEKDKHLSPKDRFRSIATGLLGSKTIIRICLAVMVIGLVMSRSRMGNAAFFISVAVVGFIAVLLIKNRSRGLLVFVASMFVIDLFIVSAYFGLEQVKERLTQTSLTSETRDEVVQDAARILQDFPLFGSGGGSFYSIFPQYQRQDVFAFYDHAHNDYLQFAIEYGLIGFFILVLIFSFALYKALRAMYRRRNSIFKGTAFAVAMALLGMGIHMTVDFPLQAYANAAYFTVFIALAMIINSLKLRTVKKSSSRTSSPRR
ncbi:O-antigen ligase family protein [Glaciecola sp. XM2]|uniref:O-antigen ligase family protein n=1 Tax=Glaciecola sp. XM2 TaxID=1914931 RepID=UPI002032652F|nr:O-antigen ligase family protein [Glaciecola sp. XM2]